MSYPCTDDPNEVIEKILDAEDSADKFDQFVNGGVNEEVQLGTGEPTPTLRNVVHLVKSAAATLDGADVSGKSSDAANGGTILRTLADRFGDFINLRDFGAVGDGSRDDSAAWTAWLAALQDSGGLGYAPAGSYRLGSASGAPTKNFPYGAIGHHEEGFTELKPGFTDRFSDAIPIGQEHVFDCTRTITVHNKTEGTAIYPTISVNAEINVHEAAQPVTMDGLAGGDLIATCHGMYVQHILTGGNANNRLMSTGIVTNAINDAKGDNDCSGIAARATKTEREDCIGDTAGLGGRVDTYSHEVGGVMGAEIVAYNYAQGVPCPTDFDNVSTRKWVAPLHVTGNVYREVETGSGTTVYRGSPMTAAILLQGGRNAAASFWEGIEFSYSLFPSFDSNPGSFIKNEILDNEDYHDGETQTYETDVYLDGGNVQHTKYRIPDTVAINMGSFSHTGGYPDTCIKMGEAKQHIWTPLRYLLVRSQGIKTFANSGPVTHYLHTDGSAAAYAFSTTQNNAEVTTGYIGTNGTDVTVSNDASGTSVVLTGGAFRKGASSTALSLGVSGYPWSHVYATTGTVETSDERLKANISNPSEALMRAWGKVGFKVFQLRESIAEKGENAARLHVGVIAQDVQRAFAEEGLDASRYGLFCFDRWEAQEAQYNEWDEEIPAERDEDGNVVSPARTVHHREMTAPAVEAGEKFSIRYEEALALECAYQRWRLDQIEARLNGMEE